MPTQSLRVLEERLIWTLKSAQGHVLAAVMKPTESRISPQQTIAITCSRTPLWAFNLTDSFNEFNAQQTM